MSELMGLWNAQLPGCVGKYHRTKEYIEVLIALRETRCGFPDALPSSILRNTVIAPPPPLFILQGSSKDNLFDYPASDPVLTSSTSS